jgi:7-cyano-7-deazaguanine reductase
MVDITARAGNAMAMSRKKSTGESLTLLGAKRTVYPTSPAAARLEAFPNPHPERDYWIRFDCPEFTSLCPITGQPDFGTIIIRYIPNRKCIESKSLKLYLFSFRNEGAFAEAIVNRVLDDIVKACKPRAAVVIGEFTPRGGIGITVEAEYPKKKRGGALLPLKMGATEEGVEH